MAHPLGLLIPLLMIGASFGERNDPLIADFIESLHTTTASPRSCGVQKQCVPFYRCKTFDAFDYICGYPDTCCEVANKITSTKSVTPVGRCVSRNVGGAGSKSLGSVESGTDYGEFPWFATLMTTREPAPESWFCNGVIIAPTVVVTTADCAEAATEVYFVQPGEWIRSERKYIQHRTRRVVKVISHDDYDASSFSYNIALLIVESPFQWEEKIAPVCLPEPNTKFDEARCYFPNWTKDNPGSSGSQAVLKRVDAPIVPTDQCLAKRRQYVGETIQSLQTDICAGGNEGKSYDVFCYAAPLVCAVVGAEDRYLLAGISSHYPQRKDATNRKYKPAKVPRVYLGIIPLLPWLHDKLTQNGIDLGQLS